MLVGVKVALKLWLIILKSREKLEKIFLNKNCSKESNLNFLFHNLSSQMKGWKDIKAVRFEFEFTSYTVPSDRISNMEYGTRNREDRICNIDNGVGGIREEWTLFI